MSRRFGTADTASFVGLYLDLWIPLTRYPKPPERDRTPEHGAGAFFFGMGMQTTREEPDTAGAATGIEKYLPPPPRQGAWPERRLAILGRGAERFFEHAGGMATLLWRTIAYLFTGRISFREVVNQMYWMGVGSIPIVLVTGMLGGIVTSQQGGYQFTGGVPLYILGSVVASSIILELGPVMTAIVLIGRVGARITAGWRERSG